MLLINDDFRIRSVRAGASTRPFCIFIIALSDTCVEVSHDMYAIFYRDLISRISNVIKAVYSIIAFEHIGYSYAHTRQILYCQRSISFGCFTTASEAHNTIMPMPKARTLDFIPFETALAHFYLLSRSAIRSMAIQDKLII